MVRLFRNSGRNWAPPVLPLLRGMYAIALIDSKNGTLVLARDPFGIKPLYYRQLPGRTIFASEPRALATLEPRARINSTAIAEFLHLGALPSDMSPFAGMEAVPPNSSVTFDADGAVLGTSQIVTEAAKEFSTSSPTEKDLAREFVTSVDLHLRADVPTVLLLSAGVDSGAIASAAHRLGRTVDCLTLSNPDADESTEAAATAAHYGHVHQVQPAQVDEEISRAFFDAMQRPTIDGLNTFLICSVVHDRGYKVAISGLGGDEPLGGYSHYRLLRALPVLRLTDRVPRLGAVTGRILRGWRPKSEGIALRSAGRSTDFKRPLAATTRASRCRARSEPSGTISTGSTGERSNRTWRHAHRYGARRTCALPGTDATSRCRCLLDAALG